MDVDVVVRSDAPTKFGGDSVQVEEYSRRLRSRGVDVQIHPYGPRMPLRAGSVVHHVNIDRPYDFLDSCRQAGGRRQVVSPIHHQLDAVRRMRRAERGQGLRSLAGRLPEGGRELLAHAVRGRRTATSPGAGVAVAAAALARGSRWMPGVWRRVGAALDAAHAVAVLARGEAATIQRDTGWSGRNALLVPNGRPVVPPEAGAGRPGREGVVVLGRIEPRKRQLDVARAATALGVPLTFAGALGEGTSRYSRDFVALVDDSPSLTYLGALAHDEVLQLLQRSRVLLNASWVEVQSLVDLEAACAGCWVVTGTAGSTLEWLGASCRSASHEDVAGAVALAHRLAQEGEPPPVDYAWTWDDAVDALLGAYGG